MILAALVLPALFLGCQEYNFAPEDDLDKPVKEEPPATDEVVDAPVARCKVGPSPVTPPFETATWDGRESSDPSGHEIVEYRWSLASKPTGSAARMPEGEAVRADFMPDLAGDYVGQLVVVNDVGAESQPCTTTLQAVPAQNLWVEMYWSHSGDDMDLHLLAPGGSLRSNSDCYYMNCVGRGLDWGERRNSDDDPSLDLDDIPGVGPENINILDPEDSVYTAYVNDYPSTVFQGDNQVTVNVYLAGQRVWSDTKTITGENKDVKFAEINWGNGTVTGF